VKDNLESKQINFLTTDEAEGKVEAVFSVFNVVDSDNDIVAPGAVKSGFGDKGVAMVWGHDWKDVIGRGVIEQDNEKAVFKGQFIMDTERGRDAFNTVKAMGDLQQWSFGFEVLDSDKKMITKNDGTEHEVRELKELKVWEVSPVLVGANQNTYTMAVKNDKSSGVRFEDEVSDVRNRLDKLINRSKELTSIRLQKEKQLSENVVKNLIDLQNSLSDAYSELDDMLNIASDEDTVDDEMTKLWLQTQQVLADTADPELI
jgi:HK97 family phage prohead protease